MNKMLIPILFAIGTAIFWGCYGPTIGNAQTPRVDGRPLLPHEGGWTPFKPYVFIGIAYLVIAVIGGLVMMKVKGDSFDFTGVHYATVKWGFLAGTLGAVGALCLTTAMMYSRGNALLVMPIVFGGAVSITALVSVIRLHDFSTVSPLLWVGMLVTVVGVVTVAMNTPHGHAPAKPKAESVETADLEVKPASGETPGSDAESVG
ncbi:MAG: hypothetical protein OSA98_05735 [Rubripirellula sp.]|nr:hypothetical protein [Rubripirellula sp.]